MTTMKRFFANILMAGVSLNASALFAQNPPANHPQQSQAASTGVVGSGTPGQLAKWAGVAGENTFTIGNSIITETKFGLIGIGTTTPSSRLSVIGTIESLSGGFKFPDGTVQTTAGLTSIFRDATLLGNGTAGSPLGIALGGVGTLQLANGAVTGQKIANGSVVRSFNGLFDNIQFLAGANITITPSANTLTIAALNALSAVTHDATLTGSGTDGSPLQVAVPLTLEGSQPSSNSILSVRNIGEGDAIFARGGDSSTESGGEGIIAVGGFSENAKGGVAVGGIGGNANSGLGGNGALVVGGESKTGEGGVGISVRGGFSEDGAAGVGVFTVGGIGAPGGTGIVSLRGLGRLDASEGLAGDFQGDVLISGALNVTGTKNFKIDHPLDPGNKYLYHAAIESSEVLNIYSGNVTTDPNGDAVITLPAWFEKVNGDLRYQLTVVGQFAQAIVADEVKNNRFTIKTSAPNVKVSWQVTGVRSDPAMLTHPFKVEEDKAAAERGYYLTPEAFGQSEEKSVQWARYSEQMKQLKERREQIKRK